MPPRRPGELWPRARFSESVWQSELSTSERIVALCYADHARAGSTAWVTADRLAARTGLSKRHAIRCRNELIKKGWLIEVNAATPTTAAEYRLMIGTGATTSPPTRALHAAGDDAKSPLGVTQNTGRDDTTSAPEVTPDPRRTDTTSDNPTTHPGTYPITSHPADIDAGEHDHNGPDGWRGCPSPDCLRARSNHHA